jgi:hypothetical protein
MVFLMSIAYGGRLSVPGQQPAAARVVDNGLQAGEEEL